MSVPTPVLPAPAQQYDRNNEAQFRAALQQSIEQIVVALNEVIRLVENQGG